MSAMNAERFGSYSSRCTTAGTPNLRRLKSIERYDCLRPPVWFLPSVRPLTGLPFHRSERSISTVPRRLAVTGLKFLIGIAVLPRRSRQPGGEVDRLARLEPDERLLHIGPHAGPTLEHPGLALLHQRVHAEHFYPEQPLDSGLDLRLRRADRHAEHHLVVLRQAGRLLGDQRRADDVVHRLAREFFARLGRDFFGPAHACAPSADVLPVSATVASAPAASGPAASGPAASG